MKRYSINDIDTISNSISVLDYFQYLERLGKVKFEKKAGRNFIFRTDNDKFSVNQDKYFSFHQYKGGKIIKAVMELDGKSWKEAVDFLADFSKTFVKEEISERLKNAKNKTTDYSPSKIFLKVEPNNEKLIDYFKNRGISEEILKNHTQQIHYSAGGKKYFGIGIENLAGGFEIRNPMMKTKVKDNDISLIKGKDESKAFVFEGMTDALSFLQLLKNNNKDLDRSIIILNSIANAEKFVNFAKENQLKRVSLILDGDKAGNDATKLIQGELNNISTSDLRSKYGIEEGKNNDLNEYLINKLQNNLSNLAKSKENESNQKQSTGIPNPIEMGREPLGRNSDELSQNSQPEQNRNNGRGQDLGGNNAGNGLESTERSNLGGGRERRRKNRNELIFEKFSRIAKKHITTGSHRVDNEQQRNERRTSGKTFERESSISNLRTNHSVRGGEPTLLDNLSSILKQKPTNALITEVVDALAFVGSDKKIILNESLPINKEVKNFISAYKSGGITKDGRGILDEYYTKNELTNAVVNLIKSNFDGQQTIKILEPSVGTGNFLKPLENLNAQKEITAFEVNETTAKIAKILNPGTEINLRSFETEFIEENSNKKDKSTFEDKYDLVIGNPPYGQGRGKYKGLGEEPKISRYDSYFVKRSIDVLKDGGVMAMVLPTTWLNSQKKLQGAELMNAFRLPNGVFAGTSVGTDIIILKKNPNQVSHDISNYFKENPNKILGEIAQKTNQFGRLEDVVKGSLEDALSQIKQLQNEQDYPNSNTLSQSNSTQEQVGKNHQTAFSEKPFSEKQSHFEIGNLFDQPTEIQPIKNNSEIDNEQNLKSDAISKISETLDVLNAIKFKSKIIANEINYYVDLRIKINDEKNDFSVEDLKEIIKKSDNIINLHSKQKEKQSKEYLIQSTPEIKKGVLKYQFQKDDEIVNTSLQNKSSISQKQIEAFQDTEYDGTLNNIGKNAEFANYIGGKWVHDFYYAEGNIYKKLEQLEIDFADKFAVGGLPNQYEKQKALLESVLPKEKKLEEIIISPNHEFVHKFSTGGTKEQKTWNQWKRDYDVLVTDKTLADEFKEFVWKLPSNAFAGSSSWEVVSFVNNQNVTGSDKERNALIRERRKEVANDLFNKFLKEELSEELKVRFVKEFNRNYNNIHVPDYSEFPLFSTIYHNFKGKPLNLTDVQKAGIGRLTTKGVGLLAHEVGFGKTLSGILSMHEAMERGNAKRPLIVVPNDNILKQWVETIFETIPDAKVNVLGNLGEKIDLSKFDNKDEEITLVTYEGFNNIGFDDSITSELSEKFSYISQSELKNVKNSVREEQLEQKKQEEVEGKMLRGKVYDWEDFGFDHLTFDEVHNANHIVGKVKIEDRRFASDFRSQSQTTSNLGINTWMAAQYIQDQYDGRNVTLLSATPFTNKPLEYYSILSLIANERLKESGYFNANTFFETFMEADNDMEIGATGEVKFKSNVRRFKNNSLFQQLLSEFIDIKGEEDNPELKRPNRLNREYKIEKNELTEEQYEILNDDYDETKDGGVLTHILNARLIAISPYLSKNYDGEKPDAKTFVENSPKLKTTMDLITQNKKDQPEAGQIIYSELGVAEFPLMKDYLVKEVGFKESEIGIITGKTTKPQKIDLQDKFNEGKIKVIIGSSAIQEGMNLQEKTSDMYLLTLPYNFTSLRQTEGRAWRQGNQWENVRINYMLTNDSIDVFMLQKLQVKQARYLEAMKQGANVVDISDVNTQELMTSIITNPEMRANIEIELENKKLQAEKERYKADIAFGARKYETYFSLIERIDEAKANITRYEEWNRENGNERWNTSIYTEKGNIERWTSEMDYEKTKLEKSGLFINILEQRMFAEEKIAEIDAKIEELPQRKQALISQFSQENEERLKRVANTDFVAERAEENKSFFKLREEEDVKIEVSEKENIEPVKSRFKR